MYVGCAAGRDGLQGRIDSHRDSSDESSDSLIKKRFWAKVVDARVRWAVTEDVLLAEAAVLAKRRSENGRLPEFNDKRGWGPTA